MEPVSTSDPQPRTGSEAATPSQALAAAVRACLSADGTVALPRLGTLRLRHEPARVETNAEGQRMLLPPRQGVAFDDGPGAATSDLPPLQIAFARHLGRPVEAARPALDDLLDAFRDLLQAGGAAALDGVGHFARGPIGLDFEPDPTLVAAVNAPFAGLAPIASAPSADHAPIAPDDPEDAAPALAAPPPSPRPTSDDEDGAPGLDGAASPPPTATVAPVPPALPAEAEPTSIAPLPLDTTAPTLSRDALEEVLDDLDAIGEEPALDLPPVPEAPLRDIASEPPAAPTPPDADAGANLSDTPSFVPPEPLGVSVEVEPPAPSDEAPDDEREVLDLHERPDLDSEMLDGELPSERDPVEEDAPQIVAPAGEQDDLDAILEGVWAPSDPPEPEHPLGPDTAPVIEDAEFDVVEEPPVEAPLSEEVVEDVEPLEDPHPDEPELAAPPQDADAPPPTPTDGPTDPATDETVGDELAALIAGAAAIATPELPNAAEGPVAPTAEPAPTRTVLPLIVDGAVDEQPASGEPVLGTLPVRSGAADRPPASPERAERRGARLPWPLLLTLALLALLTFLLWPRLFGEERAEQARTTTEEPAADEGADTFATIDPTIEGAGGVEAEASDETAAEGADEDPTTSEVEPSASAQEPSAPEASPAPADAGVAADPAPTTPVPSVTEAGIPLPLRGPGRVDPTRGGATWVLGSGDRAGAEADAARLRRLGYKASVITGNVQGRTVHRVAVGQFTTYEDALQYRSALPPGAPAGARVLRLGGPRRLSLV